MPTCFFFNKTQVKSTTYMVHGCQLCFFRFFFYFIIFCLFVNFRSFFLFFKLILFFFCSSFCVKIDNKKRCERIVYILITGVAVKNTHHVSKIQNNLPSSCNYLFNDELVSYAVEAYKIIIIAIYVIYSLLCHV